jgi:hypothetical protein
MRKNLVGAAVLGVGRLIIAPGGASSLNRVRAGSLREGHRRVNKLPLSTFQRPEEPTPGRGQP